MTKHSETQLWEEMLNNDHLPMVHYPGRTTGPWLCLAVVCGHTVTTTLAKARTNPTCPVCVATRNIRAHSGQPVGQELTATLNPKAAPVLVAALGTLSAGYPTRFMFYRPDPGKHSAPGYAGRFQASRGHPGKANVAFKAASHAVDSTAGHRPDQATPLLTLNPTPSNLATLTGITAILTTGATVTIATDGDTLTYQEAA